MTKVFTATLLADIVARGEVSLQDPVAKFLPSTVTLPARGGRQITLLDLATHHSGLPRMFADFTPADPANPYADFTVEKMYEFLARYELPRDIGSKGEYSNLGVGLLGHALTQVTGKSYEMTVRERILDPLEMRMTGISLAGDRQDWMVKGHNRSGQVVPLWDAPAIAGAGALRSNAEDLLKFIDANVRPPTSRLQQAMRASHIIQKPAPGNAAIGLAWQVFTYGDETLIRHSGGTSRFKSFMGFDPNKRVGVVILINTTSADRNDAQNIGMHLTNPTHNPLK
jgi:CubicO group peptidase (beta-lactamase class C family)